MRSISVSMLTLLLLLACGISIAAAPPSLRVTARDPTGSAQLPVPAELNLRVHYVSTSPLRLQARGYEGTRRLDGPVGTAPLLTAGEGDALVWIGTSRPAHIDRVRVIAYDAGWHRVGALDVPINVQWRVGAAAHRSAAWVAPLSRQMGMHTVVLPRRPSSAWFGLLFALLMASVPAYPLAQLVAAWRLRGRRRLVALAPLAVMLPLYVFVLLASLGGAHLAPIWIVFVSPLALLWVLLSAFWPGRRASG